jgi:hypothetical protein
MARPPSNGPQLPVGRADLTNLHNDFRFGPDREWELALKKEARRVRGESSFFLFTAAFSALFYLETQKPEWSSLVLVFYAIMSVASFAALTRFYMINVDAYLPKPGFWQSIFGLLKSRNALPAGKGSGKSRRKK